MFRVTSASVDAPLVLGGAGLVEHMAQICMYVCAVVARACRREDKKSMSNYESVARHLSPPPPFALLLCTIIS